MGTFTHRQNVVESFDEFRKDLDEHHDRRERLIKVHEIIEQSQHSDSHPLDQSGCDQPIKKGHIPAPPHNN